MGDQMETTNEASEAMIPWIKTDDGFQVILSDGTSEVVARDHENYDELFEAVMSGNEQRFRELFDVQTLANKSFDGTDVSVQDGVVFYKGHEVHNTLTDRIVEFAEEGAPVEHMVKFLDNLMDNPSHRAVNELYDFLELRGMPITYDGCFQAYKAVRSDYTDKYSGEIDNSPGAVVSMPRNQVDDNRDRHCSEGLHVGAWDYAGPDGWYAGHGDRIMLVKVNPRDAVSVPSDHGCTKLRVCKYKVVREYTAHRQLEGPSASLQIGRAHV